MVAQPGLLAAHSYMYCNHETAVLRLYYRIGGWCECVVDLSLKADYSIMNNLLNFWFSWLTNDSPMVGPTCLLLHVLNKS